MTDPASGPDPDRRVLRKTPPATPAVQAWLDGEEPRDALVDTGENETAELWTRINSETEQLRRRTTPMHVQQRILSALPDGPPGPGPSTPQKSGLSPAVLAIGGIAALVIGTMIGLMLVR
ncbi:MAG: hypothetical protein ABIR58_07005 [Gemmatimonadaceae bacterium]